MSGISRITLRFIGTAKYCTNNSTKYLCTMPLSTNCLNKSLALLQPQYLNHNKFTQAKKMSTTIGSIFGAAKEKMSLLLAGQYEAIIKESNTDLLKVSLSSGKIKLITPQKNKKLIFLPTLSIKLNGKLIESKSNEDEETLSFNLGKWNVLRDDDKLIFKVKKTGETFILEHAIHIIAHEKPLLRQEDGGYKQLPTGRLSDILIYPAKLISKPEQSDVLERSFEPVYTPVPKFNIYGNILPGTLAAAKEKDEITDKPNSEARIKLTFPMTASLEGAQQKITMKDSDDYCTVYHTVNVKAYKKLPKHGNNEDDTLKIGKLQMKLESGDLIIKSFSSNQRVIIKQEADIEIDLDSKVPNICICPHIERSGP